LQEYLESKNGKFTIKKFYNYEIYKKDTSYFCSYRIDEFQNDIIIDIELTKSQLEKFRGKTNNLEYSSHAVAVLKIYDLEPIDFEFRSEMDDYHSRIEIEQYNSLRRKGRIEKIEFVKEKRHDDKKNNNEP